MSARPAKLPPEEVEQRASELEGWTVRDGKLHCELEFPTFAEAFGFMASAAIFAQELDHHPDWSNSYNKVVIDLSSHDVKGISERDFDLAGRMNALAAARSPRA
ncbi:MAG: 4a-hydroxytetrahydrobiopterin dehydratase [Gemmatimonadota bacterium]